MIGKSALLHPITSAEMASFDEDGVVCLRNPLGQGWLERLQRATDEIISQRWGTIEYSAAGRPGRFVSGLFMWRFHPVFRDFVYRSPAAAIAGEIMRSAKINVLFDHLLVKEPGTLEPTLFHHDEPFWPVAGSQVCTVWTALDPVTLPTGGLLYVAGSHTWPERFRPYPPFSPEIARRRNMDLPDCSTFLKERGEYRTVSWDMEPGDCLVFNARVIHGSSGNSSSTTRRRGFATRWCGDNVTFIDDNFVLDLPEPAGLATGDPLDSDLFPVIWRR